MKQDCIIVEGACENNLRNITVEIPKHKITVFTGVSGSGKSSLVLDTIAAKSRRELNDTFPPFVQQYLPKYGRPHVGKILNLPIAIVIDQKKPGANSRSTVGTYTDIYSLLRLLFSRIGEPFVGYSDTFSFNHPSGSCPRCSGLGEIRELDVHKLVDFDKCLNDEDAIHYIAFHKGGWRWIRYACSGLFDLDKKFRDYSEEELRLFLYSPQIKLENPPERWPKTAKYEGLVHRMYRSIINSEEGLLHRKLLEPMLVTGTCPDCGGTRLNPKALSCKIAGMDIARLCAMSVSELNAWIDVNVTRPLAADMRKAIMERLSALEEIGLGYLSLSRPLDTLSGGEAQRCKIAKYINSSLSDVLYVMDEPSVGLHDYDIGLLKDSVVRLRDAGNTVLLVEHNKEMLKVADHIVDLGPGAGEDGGRVVFEGTYAGLLSSGTVTGKMASSTGEWEKSPSVPLRKFPIRGACLHNLKSVDVDMPLDVVTVIAGVAGSGKTSLVESFVSAYPRPEDIVYISQKNIGISLRSTPATYLGAADDIRRMFAKENGVGMEYLTFNSKGGCPVCGGKGVVVSDMAFMDSIESVCEACSGLRYSQEALRYRIDRGGRQWNIAEIMDMTAGNACRLFEGTAIEGKLRPLVSVGLEYLHLNQAMSTLSGGELRRMKLAGALGGNHEIVIMDEPTDGLHPGDVYKMISLCRSLHAGGKGIILVEHNTDIIRSADYVIELGPGGGDKGGRLLYAGPPAGLLSSPESVTGRFL